MSVPLSELFPDPAVTEWRSAGNRADLSHAQRLTSLSVIFPALNEQYNLRRTVEDARKILPRIADAWEIIVVNDGSGDATGPICDTLANQTSAVRVLHHHGNKGYGAALKTGIIAARHDWVFFSDSDGQFDLTDLALLLEHSETHDIVAGYRARRNDPPYRALNAWGWNRLVRLTLGVRVRDIDCAFKLFRRRVFEQVQIHSVGAMVNTEIFAQAFKFGLKIKEVEVTHHPRLHGQPTGAKLRVIVKAFRELIRMRSKLRSIAADQEGLYARKPAQADLFDGQHRIAATK